MSQLEEECADEEGGEAEVCAGGGVAGLVVSVTLGLLAQDAFVAIGAEAPLVLVAGAAVLANQELLVADVGETALSPVVIGKAVVTLGPGGTFSAFTVAGLVTAVVQRPDLIAVTFYAHILVVELCRAVPVKPQPAVLAVLPPRVVFAADAGHHVQEVDIAAAVGVAVALAVSKHFNRCHWARASIQPDEFGAL